MKKIFIIAVLISFWFILNSAFWYTILNEDCANTFSNASLNEANSGCPILDETCSATKACSTWMTCSSEWFCEVTKETKLVWTCWYNSNWSWIFWNAICSTCPCDYSFNFTTILRNCDTVVPAITSIDNKTIYWVWDYFKISR